MFGRDKYSKITKTKETCIENGTIQDLVNCEDKTAVQAVYVYKRSNYNQQSFLDSVLSPYIKIKKKILITDSLSWDYADETVLSKTVESFNPPYEIRQKVGELYKQMLDRGTITNAEKREIEKQAKIDEGFNNFFNK